MRQNSKRGFRYLSLKPPIDRPGNKSLPLLTKKSNIAKIVIIINAIASFSPWFSPLTKRNKKGSDRISRAEIWTYRRHFSRHIFFISTKLIGSKQESNNIKTIQNTLKHVYIQDVLTYFISWPGYFISEFVITEFSLSVKPFSIFWAFAILHLKL